MLCLGVVLSGFLMDCVLESCVGCDGVCVSGVCDGCVFDRGVGYLQHKHDCNKYVMCYATEFQGHVTGKVRMCGVGKYWDQGHVTCKPTHMAHCDHGEIINKHNNIF